MRAIATASSHGWGVRIILSSCCMHRELHCPDFMSSLAEQPEAEHRESTRNGGPALPPWVRT